MEGFNHNPSLDWKWAAWRVVPAIGTEKEVLASTPPSFRHTQTLVNPQFHLPFLLFPSYMHACSSHSVMCQTLTESMDFSPPSSLSWYYSPSKSTRVVTMPFSQQSYWDRPSISGGSCIGMPDSLPTEPWEAPLGQLSMRKRKEATDTDNPWDNGSSQW